MERGHSVLLGCDGLWGAEKPSLHSPGISKGSVQGWAVAAALWKGRVVFWLEEQLCSGPRTECQVSCSVGVGFSAVCPSWLCEQHFSSKEQFIRLVQVVWVPPYQPWLIEQLVPCCCSSAVSSALQAAR